MGIQKLTPSSGGRTTLTTFTETLVQSAGVVGNVALDLAQTNNFVVIAGAGDVTLSFANPPPAGQVAPIKLKLVQDGVGGRQFIFPPSVVWPLNVVPNMPQGANAEAVIQLVTFDGGASYSAQVLSSDAGADLFPLAGLMGGGVDYVPQFTGSAKNPIMGNATLIGRHIDLGQLCVCTIQLVIGSLTVIQADMGVWHFSLAHPVRDTTAVGVARYVRGPTPNAIMGTVVPQGGNIVALNMNVAAAPDMDAPTSQAIGGVAPAAGDFLTMFLAFEAA